ncbi:unnamed protein product [Gongylonema pulchrum]|uniref:BMERB domain-containing protein n=1 Tax=Gongylonema pulchrum TaxID=637853 RepID=A0A3P7QD18_9BILA|nr:unnamed protein product [Gongylonema pulchrum]
MQRELEEIEVRKSEVEAVAGDLEKRLRIDAENVWILEQWLLYVEEMNQLKQRENELKLQVREFEVNEEYRNLQQKLKEIQCADANTDATNSESEKSILTRTLAVVEERDALQQQLKEIKERAREHATTEPATLIRLKGASYHNFEPVFI